MSAIYIRTRLESDSPHLPELRPFVGRNVEITVVAEEPVAELAPGHGNWDAVSQAVKGLIADGQYDFDAVRHDHFDRSLTPSAAPPSPGSSTSAPSCPC